MVANAISIPSNTPIDDTSFKIDFNTNSLTLTPIFGGVVQKVGRGGDLWSVSASTRQMDKPDALALTSILNQANTRPIRFALPFKTSLGNATAVAGSGQGLTLSGLPSGAVLKAGSFLTIEYNRSGTIYSYLHQITQDVSESGGAATVSIIPSLRRTSNLAGSNVVLGSPYIQGFATTGTSTLTSSNYRLDTYKTAFSIIEVE